ncbi:phytochelatin synthase family protein [Endozoicomonadaceae bacterium StTr2]
MIIKFSSEQGVALFQGSEYINFKVIESFSPQEHPTFCGIAVLRTIFNAERLFESGFVKGYEGFDESVYSVRSFDKISGVDREKYYAGLSKEDVLKIANNLFVDASLVSSTLTQSVFESDLADSFSSYYWIVNFFGNSLGLKSRGHFCLIGAWNQKANMVLLLDPARHKNGWYWVSTDTLASAMTETIPDTTRIRGYIKVRKSSDSVS